MNDGLKVSKSKPVKEEVVNEWSSIIAYHNETLISCGCKDVAEYTREPWNINDIRAVIKWFRNNLEPKINDLNRELSRLTPEQWRLLAVTVPNDLRTINSYKRQIAVLWAKRPRFKEDIKRWEQGV